MKTSQATSNLDAGKTRSGKLIVALQMALCVVLLVGGGLLIRSLRNLQNVPLGMRMEGLVVFGVHPQSAHTYAEGVAFYQELVRRLRVLPGVDAVTIMENRLGSGWSNNGDMMVDGQLPNAATGSRWVRSNTVGPDFFHTLEVPILAGREFTDADTLSSTPVAVVNELFAARFLLNQNPLGHRIVRVNQTNAMVIVGVVRDHKYRSIDEEPVPMAWSACTQGQNVGEMHIEMRDPASLYRFFPKSVKWCSSDPNLPLIEPTTTKGTVRPDPISQRLLFTRLGGFFGLLAVVLVATGLYGTITYRVNNRTVEIGVRVWQWGHSGGK